MEHQLDGGDLLIDAATNVELFHSANGIAFADIVVDAHRETVAVRASVLG